MHLLETVRFVVAIVFVSSAKTQNRIVGGKSVNIEHYPHQVSVQFYTSVCGGSIIGRSWILTAAHCLRPGFEDFYTIRAGSTKLYTGGLTRKIQRMIRHDRYAQFRHFTQYDFGLLELTTELQFGNSIRSIGLPLATSVVEDGKEAVVSGWGLVQEYTPMISRNLHAVTVRTVNQDVCRKAYDLYGIAIKTDMVCAAEVGKDACQGDSGGPMTVNGILVGVVSWGVGCADLKFPGVYGRVSKARNWIQMHTGI